MRHICNNVYGLILTLLLITTTAFAQDSVGTDQGADATTQTTATPSSLHGMGLIPSAKVVELPTHSHAVGVAPLPATVDLTQWSVPVGDQGQVDSCVGWAVGYGLMGWYANRLNMAPTTFAPMYMYSQINFSYMYSSDPQLVSEMCGNENDCGANISDGFNLAMDQGVDTESDYSQGDYDWKDQPAAVEQVNAAYYKINQWNYIFSSPSDGSGTGINGQIAIQTALANSQPVVLGMAVREYMYFNYWNVSQDTLDSDITSDVVGDHALLAVGYDQDGLLVQNSWGTSWGFGGFGRLAWAVVQQDVYEAYTVDSAAFGPYAITPISSAGGTINPSTPVAVKAGTSTSFKITPSSKFAIASVTGCGGSLSGTTYTVSHIGANCTVTATFGKATYTVTASAGVHGSITPAQSVLVEWGNTAQFTFEPDPGYVVVRPVGGTCGGSLNIRNDVYTTNTVKGNCTVVATFKKGASPIQGSNQPITAPFGMISRVP
ncbi:MAG: C1 family peptidase [Rhodanobacter sp.]|jgi:C1A family cysteine protease|nr:C1 family peptidase [Rhodanobacter sp.]